MGVLKSMREVQSQSREIQRHADPSAMLGGALERMKATGESIAAMTQAAQVAGTGVEA